MPDAVMHLAAESHVDRSIDTPSIFVQSNIVGTYEILEASKKYWEYQGKPESFRFHHISTDEVYGSLGKTGLFTESTPYDPKSPYSASKASSDHLVSAYHRTYGIKCITTRCTNNFGPYQFPEKLIPKTIIRAKKNLKIPLYGNGEQIRSWIYVYDHVQAIEDLISNGELGQVYNITAWNEITNKSIVENILKLLNKSKDLIENVEDRPGHDKRYSIDASKIKREINWKPKYDFTQSLKDTVEWYDKNYSWWEPLIDEKSLHPQPWTLKWE